MPLKKETKPKWFLVKSKYFSGFKFPLTQWPAKTTNPQIDNFFSFLSIKTKFGLLIKSVRSTFILSCEFFPPALVGGLLLKSERQQVSLGHQDSSEYSSQS